MYRYENIKTVHLEITTKCQAKCPMCPRRLNGGILNPFIELTEITLNQFKTWFEPNFIKQLDHIYMCGNLGDAIVAKDTLKIIQYIRSINPKMRLHLNTNGSARSSSWWKELAKQNVYVIFGIDGLEDTHHLYRVDTNWQKIIENAKTFINHGGKARWDMLVFDHNQHQVDDCRNLSKTLGFDSFTIKHTSRFKNNKFEVLNELGYSTHVLYPTDKSKEMIRKVELAQKETCSVITCKAKRDQQIYISATGNVSPCCWLDLEWYPHNFESRIDYMNKIGKFPNLQSSSLIEIFQSNFFEEVEATWSNNSLRECLKQCGSFDKLNEQFV